MVREKIIEILKELHDEIDYDTCTTLIDAKVLDSFDIITLISEISSELDVTIPAEKIVPENFNSADALAAMVEELLEE